MAERTGWRPWSLASPIWLVALAGDLIVLLVFAALGRSSHGESQGPLKILITAAPFMAGWLAASVVTGAYRPKAFADVRVAAGTAALTWIPGGIIGLGLRSLSEHRVVPMSFAAVALLFNLIVLSAWRSAFSAVLKRL